MRGCRQGVGRDEGGRWPVGSGTARARPRGRREVSAPQELRETGQLGCRR